MGLNSELIAIGDYKFLSEMNLLDGAYHNPRPDSLVVTTIALCDTNDQSRNLAKLCGKDFGDYNDDLVVTCVEPEVIFVPEGLEDYGEMLGCDTIMSIYRLIKHMLNHPQQVELYLRL